MELIKKHYIHNCIKLDNEEKEILKKAENILLSIHDENIKVIGEDDSFLGQLCIETMKSIDKILENYTNEYRI